MAEHRIDAGALYTAHIGFVTAFLLRRGTPRDDVADVAQEVFLIAHRKGGFVQGTAKATSWLGAIAVRVASDMRKKRDRHRGREPSDTGAVAHARATNPSPRDKTQAKEQLKRVRRALRGLPASKRAVFTMFEIEGRTCREIAEVLRLPVGTVYSRLHDARALFERCYASRDSDIPLAVSDSITFVEAEANASEGVARAAP